jgi:hypothetical protein
VNLFPFSTAWRRLSAHSSACGRICCAATSLLTASIRLRHAVKISRRGAKAKSPRTRPGLAWIPPSWMNSPGQPSRAAAGSGCTLAPGNAMHEPSWRLWPFGGVERNRFAETDLDRSNLGPPLQRFTARNPKSRTGIVPNHRPVRRQFAPDIPLLRSLRLFAAPTPRVQSRTGNLSAGARTAPCTGVSRISWVRKGSNCFFRLTTPSIL